MRSTFYLDYSWGGGGGNSGSAAASIANQPGHYRYSKPITALQTLSTPDEEAI